MRTDTVFAGSIPAFYDRYLGPMNCAPYAADLVARIGALAPARVLEVAAGTGIVTRARAQALPAGVEIIATDLNQPMLDFAAMQPVVERVVWRQADALHFRSTTGCSTWSSANSASCSFLT